MCTKACVLHYMCKLFACALCVCTYVCDCVHTCINFAFVCVNVRECLCTYVLYALVCRCMCFYIYGCMCASISAP